MNTLANQYPVSIVVPIYNVEPFIERCAVSLFEQEFDDIEYIFVDDATPDNSIDVLKQVIERYPQRANHVQIIHNAENLGLFQTRKIGVMAASGEYIQHIDSDDWVEPDMISSMYTMAKKENADVVTCDFYIEKPNEVIYREQKHWEDHHQLFVAFLRGWIGPTVWCRLIKRDLHLSLYDELNLNRHLNLSEDWLITLPLYCLPLNISYVPRALYHYNRQNPHSITRELATSLYEDRNFILKFLFDFLKSRLSIGQFALLKEKFGVHSCNIAFLMLKKPDFMLLKQFDFNLLRLWQTPCAKLPHKIVYSFYFLYLPWIPKIIQRMRRAVQQWRM